MQPRSVQSVDDIAPSPLAPATVTGSNGPGGLLTTDAGPVAAAMLARLDTEHPVLSGQPARERLLAATWLAGYRSARTRRAYAGDLAAWLDWLHGVDVDALHARRVHIDLWVRQLVDAGAAASSTSRRLSALSSWYRHLVEHDLIPANPAAAVRRPTVDPDHTSTVGLDRDQTRAAASAPIVCGCCGSGFTVDEPDPGGDPDVGGERTTDEHRDRIDGCAGVVAVARPRGLPGHRRPGACRPDHGRVGPRSAGPKVARLRDDGRVRAAPR